MEPEKSKEKNKTIVGKVGVELKTIGILAITHNHYTTSRTAFSWQSDLFVDIVPCHETASVTGGTIAPADLLPPEYRR